MDNEILNELTGLRQEIKEIKDEIRELKFKICDVKSEIRALNSKLDTYQNVFYFTIIFIAIVTALAPFLYSVLKTLSSAPKITRGELEPIIKEIISSSQLKQVDGVK